MKTILSVIKDFMSQTKNKDNSFSFDELFEQVEKNLSPEWAKQSEIDFDDMISKKKGETYKLLTIDGSFVRNDDGTFKLRGN